jgi:hypothetical protein
MQDNDIINLWKASDKKIEDTMIINQHLIEDITKLKVHSLIKSMTFIKVFAIIIGIVWVLFLNCLIFSVYKFASIYFLVAVGLNSLLTFIAIVVYIYQLVLIHHTNIENSVLETQRRLAKLKASTFWITRVLFLQLPLWTIFYWNKGMWSNGNIILHILQIFITASLTYLAIWLFMNIKNENRDKSWFKFLFNGKEWAPVLKSMDMLEQIKNEK